MRYVWLSVGAEPEKGLHSTSTVHVLHMLRRLTHDGMDVDIDAPTSVLCIRCYRLLDKCIKLKRKLDLAEQEAAVCVNRLYAEDANLRTQPWPCIA